MSKIIWIRTEYEWGVLIIITSSTFYITPITRGWRNMFALCTLSEITGNQLIGATFGYRGFTTGSHMVWRPVFHSARALFYSTNFFVILGFRNLLTLSRGSTTRFVESTEGSSTDELEDHWFATVGVGTAECERRSVGVRGVKRGWDSMSDRGWNLF